MKKTIFFSLLAIGLIAILMWLGKKNSKSVEEFDTEKAFKATIVRKSVATGTVVPLEEVEIKPQVSGIIDKIYVKEGQQVKVGDLIAKVRVVPNVQALNSAGGRVKSAKLRKDNARVTYDRTKALYDKGVIARTEFESSELAYNTAKQEYDDAINNRQIIRKGSTMGAGTSANTNIRATIKGTILEIPVRKGNQVIESNTFNAGTTIATIADMNKMIFEGKVDEAEVGKLIKGTAIDVSLGAIQDKKFPAILTFIAPKGSEEQGAVQFKIKADVALDKEYFIRAGYSANANIVLEKKDSVLSVREALLRFDKKTDEPYVEIKTGDKEYERKEIKLGVSDGINVEILEGITAKDDIKIWNKASKDKDKKDD
jgi:HlyD family secretion protein